jgi:hypothetical protein
LFNYICYNVILILHLLKRDIFNCRESRETKKRKEIHDLIPVLVSGYPQSVGHPAFKGTATNTTYNPETTSKKPKVGPTLGTYNTSQENKTNNIETQRVKHFLVSK